MIIDATIEHLREYCPPFSGRVAGAADFSLGLRNYNTNMVLPSAYVLPLGQDSDRNRNMVGYFAIVHKVIGIAVEFDARPDRRGQAPAMQYDAIERALCLAMLNWRPVECATPNGQGFYLVGARFLDLDRARLFYQWEFGLDWQLNDDDGWQQPSEPLRRIRVDVHKAPLEENPDPAAIIDIPTGRRHPHRPPNGEDEDTETEEVPL